MLLEALQRLGTHEVGLSSLCELLLRTSTDIGIYGGSATTHVKTKDP